MEDSTYSVPSFNPSYSAILFTRALCPSLKTNRQGVVRTSLAVSHLGNLPLGFSGRFHSGPALLLRFNDVAKSLGRNL